MKMTQKTKILKLKKQLKKQLKKKKIYIYI